MTPADGIFSHIGGDGQINVTASEPECSWNVTVHWSYQHWVFLGSPSGRDGSGNMTFEIASHDEELPRDAVLSVNGDDGFSRVFNITQTGKPKPAKFSVASVARTRGQGGSNWSTQLRLTNPEDHVMPVLVRFVRLDLTQEDLITEVSIPDFPLQPHVTYFVEDIVSAIAGNLEGEDVKGALQIEVQDEVEGQPVITSRTATKAAEGSYGQFIPAVPMIHTDVQEVVLVGLADNDVYRTNIGVTNLENRIVNVDLVAIDSGGNIIGEKRVGVPRLANNQVGVRDLFPDFVDSDSFSVRANTGDADVTVYGQMMHRITSDPMYIGSDQTVSKVQVIPNLAHNRGSSFSVWRSDVAIYNPNPASINLHMEYVPDPADGFWWPSKRIMVQLQAYETNVLHDVVREFLTYEDDESKGYMIVESNESELAPPVIVGRTYTIDGEKVYGQGLSVVGEQAMLSEGDVAWFAGVEDSAGVRTNFSIINTGSDAARVELRFYDEHGIVRAGAKTLTFPEKDEFLQFDLFKALPELEPGSMRGSLQILVREGESVFPYVTIMDNLSNDPMFVTPTVMEY
ncbi:MAG: hypothetical protein GY906_38840 [bacterium]|nr:hypothetical protein [bacterium]